MRYGKTVTENLQSLALKEVLGYLDSNPDKNLPRIVNWVDKFDRERVNERQLRTIRQIVGDPNGNWYKLMKSLWTDVDSEVRKTLFENFIINSRMIGGQRQKKACETNDCQVPWAILISPTSVCNLHCTGCWAAEYGHKLNLRFDILDQIITQGKELGVYMYLYSGGEPLVRKSDIIKLCQKHADCVFCAFTNGTLIDDRFSAEMLRVKNFIPAFSIEGFAKETDQRRGEGTYAAVIKAMEILQDKKLPFGISCCYTRLNAEVIGSEKFIDAMIARGAKFAWFFTYIPIGADAQPELMATAEQRAYMYHQIRKFRQSKPLFTMDFWNDGEYIDGCIAGGRCYLHINANGDIEPCAFIHYSNCNIHDTTLLEALKSPLFQQYRQNQPFNENPLRPCPLLDNPERITEMVKKSNAQSTGMESPETVEELSAKCKDAAQAWAPVAQCLWQKPAVRITEALPVPGSKYSHKSA